MRPLISLDREKVLEILPKMIEEGWSARKVEQYIAGSKPKSSVGAIKTNEYLKEEGKLAEEYGVTVKIRGRSVTFSARSDEEFKALLKKL